MIVPYRLMLRYPQDVMEHLSYAYVYAVATQARCAFERPVVDRDSVDARLSFRNDHESEATINSPTIDLQIKANVLEPLPEDKVPYWLKLKNHHDLVKRTMIPRILVVVFLPKDPESWLSLSDQELVLRRCGLWMNLQGLPPTTNGTGETVYLPRHQIFDPPTLERFMRYAGRQERLV